MDLIETFVNYHENIKKCVCIVYDPQRSARGGLALKAIRLKDNVSQGDTRDIEITYAGLAFKSNPPQGQCESG